MKATRILFACSVLLLLGACTEPPFGHPGYPRGSSSLRYPPNYIQPQGRNYHDPNNNFQGNRWERPPGYLRPGDPGYVPTRPREELEPEPEPQPRQPEDDPLVEDFDPLEEAKPKYEYAIPVQGASNLVVSPYAKEGPYIDISGLSSGTQIECPKTKKTILVP